MIGFKYGNAHYFYRRNLMGDVTLGLYYLRARYYDPETGRFISQDDVSYLAPTHLSGTVTND